MKIKLTMMAILTVMASSLHASTLFQFIGSGSYAGYISTWIPDKLLYSGSYGDVYTVVYGDLYTPELGDQTFSTITINNDRGGQIHPSTGAITGVTAGVRLWFSPSGTDQTTVYGSGEIPAVGTYTVSDPVGKITSFDVGDVPEPTTWALMLAGFAGVGMKIRWQRSRSSIASQGNTITC